MSYFAKVSTFTDGKGVVENVINADQAFIDSGYAGNPIDWWQTSYNTRGGVHYGQDGQPDGGVALRANYASINYILDMNVIENGIMGVFYAPQPYPSWTISAPTWIWQPPVPYPKNGGQYVWDEATQSWVPV